jgi:hypothetical protein
MSPICVGDIPDCLITAFKAAANNSSGYVSCKK